MQQSQRAAHRHPFDQQTSFAWDNVGYSRRRPESTLLFNVVQENYKSFEDLFELEGRGIPMHVAAEFDAFLKCGVLAHGFLRFQCQSCLISESATQRKTA